jgi:hypothetical protein
MTTTTLGSFCPGVLEILSIGKGDIKLSIDNNDEDKAKAKAVIEEMLRKGYSIFVETDDGMQRVTQFNPNRMSYTITEVVPTLPAPAEPKALPPGEPRATPARRAASRRQRRTREVPVSGSKATAVGRTAGG